METGLGSGASDRSDGASDMLRQRDGRFGGNRPSLGDGHLGRDKPGLGDGLHRDMRFNQFASGEGEREGAFHDKVQRALREATHADDFAEERDRARLLATAGTEPTPQQAAVRQPAAPAGEPGAARADQALRIDALADRVEAAAKAEMRTGRAGAFALRIDLGGEGVQGEVVGLASVTIRFSPEGLDIVLARTDDVASAAYLAAAQALADRLHQRFERRVVRVYEAPPAEAQSPRDGMSEISGLFRQAGGRT